jgi:hypothetical protein
MELIVIWPHMYILSPVRDSLGLQDGDNCQRGSKSNTPFNNRFHVEISIAPLQQFHKRFMYDYIPLSDSPHNWKIMFKYEAGIKLKPYILEVICIIFFYVWHFTSNSKLFSKV